MTTFPITYVEIIIWIILITFNDDFYWTRFGVKVLGAIFGIWLSIYTFNGTYWLYVDTNGVYTLSQVKDNFQLPLALIVLGISLILWLTLAMSLSSKDWTKNGNT